MENESNVIVSSQKQIREANKLLLAKTEAFSETNINHAKSIYKRILGSSTNDNAMSAVTARKMLRLLEVLENYLPGAHRNNKADIASVADVLFYNKFYFNDCYKDLLEDLDEAIFYWYDKAALLGSASAYLKKARFYLYGHGVKPSVVEAIESYKQASEGSKDAWTVWAAVKNNEVPLRADLADDVNVIKFYLFSEGLLNYEQNYEKAKDILSNLSDVTVAKSLSAILTVKVENNKARIINESILSKSKEYEDLKRHVLEINEQSTEAERLKNELFLQLDNVKSDIVKAQNILSEMDGEISEKESNIVTINKRLQEMAIEESALIRSCDSKKIELTSLERQLLELGQKFEKVASDCAALETKYAVLNEFKEVEVASPGVIEFMNKAQKGDKDSLYKYALCLKYGIGVKRNVELASKYLQMLIPD
jgi:TPR repeat protein